MYAPSVGNERLMIICFDNPVYRDLRPSAKYHCHPTTWHTGIIFGPHPNIEHIDILKFCGKRVRILSFLRRLFLLMVLSSNAPGITWSRIAAAAASAAFFPTKQSGWFLCCVLNRAYTAQKSWLFLWLS